MRRPKRKKEYIQVLRRLILAEPAEDGSGYSWTLAAALGEMLLFAEEKFGLRDTSWTILGIDFATDHSKTWTPGNGTHIIVQLHSDVLMDRHYAYKYLAHECIHLLSPTGKADANMLEEGLAVSFARWYMQYVFGEGWWLNEHPLPRYARACILAEQLLALDADIIKKLRVVQPVIARITADQIQELCPAASRELALALAESFTQPAEGNEDGVVSSPHINLQ